MRWKIQKRAEFSGRLVGPHLPPGVVVAMTHDQSGQAKPSEGQRWQQARPYRDPGNSTTLDTGTDKSG